MEAARTSEMSVDNYFTRQYIPEDNSEFHTRSRKNFKSHLREVVLPDLENSPLYNTETIWQQGGAPPHYSLRVREFLNNSFPELIGRRGTVDCPPQSCDQTPC
jgi:hypothetical protein